MIPLLPLFRIPSTIFGMPWHELKALHRETVEDDNTKRSKKHRRKLLGKLSTDLEYLEGLLTDVKLGQAVTEKESTDDIIAPIITPTKPTEEDGVSKKAQEAISFLKERQEFWSQFKPMYSK